MPTPVVEGDDTAVVVDALVVLSTSALTSNAQRVAGAPGVPAVDDAVSIDVEPPAVENVAASTTHAIVAAPAGPVVMRKVDAPSPLSPQPSHNSHPSRPSHLLRRRRRKRRQVSRPRLRRRVASNA